MTNLRTWSSLTMASMMLLLPLGAVGGTAGAGIGMEAEAGGDAAPGAGGLVLDPATWVAMARAGTLPSDCGLSPGGLATRDLLTRPVVEPEETGIADPEECGGIRPGARLSNGCTMNFVFTNGADLFIGTAGHCTNSLNQRMSAPGVGEFGSVAYRINAGLGNDFALIRIDADKRAQTNPTMCTFGGPSGMHDGQMPFGEVLQEYGWGVATQFTSATRSRVHAGSSQSATSVGWVGVGSGGDSGAPLTDSQDRAIAIHTHGVTPIVGVIGEAGVYVHRAVGLAAGAGVQVSLVTGAADAAEELPEDHPHRHLFAA